MQMILIVNSIKEHLPAHAWYGADVQAVGKNATKYSLRNIQLNRIGSDAEFIKYCTGIEQFTWGVFLCIDNQFFGQKFGEVEVATEDEPFRSINCEGILIEIRTFDTTFFEIYSENLELITKIANFYGVTIESTSRGFIEHGHK
jgi:hypothetical protein